MIRTNFYKIFFFTSLFWLSSIGVSAQLVKKFGDNTNYITDKAILELESTSRGFLLPRMTKDQMLAIINPPTGLMLVCIDCLNASNSVIKIYASDSWTSVLTSELDLELASSHILLGNSSQKATAVTLSGDIRLNNTGVVTVVNNAITESKISASSVSYSKIQNVTPNRILGRTSSGIGYVEEITITGTGSVVLSDSPILTGTPSLPTGTSGITQTAKNNTTAIATTAYVDNANATNADLTGAITSTGNATLLGSFTSADLAFALTDETGTASVVLSDSPTLTGTTTTSAISATSIAVSGALGVTGATSLTTLKTNGLATLNSAAITTTIDVAGVTNLNNTTESTAATNGALIVLGGAGVAKNLNVGAAMGVTGTTTLSTLSTSGLATLYSAGIATNASIGGSLQVTGITTLAAQPILQTLDPLLPVFTDDKRGLVSNSITGAENVVMSKSPTLSGVPLAPTAELSTNTAQIATTAFVLSNSDQYYSVTASNPISTRATSDEAAMSLTSATGGTYAVSFNAQYSIDPSDRTAAANSDLKTAYDTLMLVRNSAGEETPIIAAIGTQVYTPGVYSDLDAGTITAGATITLSGSGTFIFKFGAAFDSGADVNIVLTNGAQAKNIFWIAQAALGLGANTHMKGTLISNNGAISFGATCTLEGKALVLNAGACAVPGGSVMNTGASTIVNWGLMTDFALFTNSGAITGGGAGNWIINGDIGSKSGLIATSSFQAPNFTGTFYTSTIASGKASFSLYQNAGLITNSTRTRSSSLNIGDVSLQAIAIVGPGEKIDIRYSIDSGEVTLNNRILTAIKVR